MIPSWLQSVRGTVGGRWGRSRLEPVGVLVQACLGAGTVPGLLNGLAGGKTFLEHQLERVLIVFDRPRCLVVTTELPENRAIRRICGDLGVPCYVGDRYDALGNCLRAARRERFRSAMVLRADSPLIDPALMVRVMAEYLRCGHPSTYTGNRLQKTFPAGMEVEITGVDRLQQAFLAAQCWADFLDPTALLRRGGLADCRRVDVVQSVDQSRWSLRLDTADDQRRLARLLGLVQKYSLEEVMRVAEVHGLLAEPSTTGGRGPVPGSDAG